ncbi:hypothetical protein EIZ62_07320 [Streptomyces ficellus]|uniref:Uncharacterized protein n=2 Tax=Streptomyces ficellus TaxID=1977088 RepID=A0A6I6FGP5_9ACTN|nr:hypothetical protein EIZ62_07320 [Streptomyces ficellus]
MGVYGTVLGAGVISVIATCGGSVLQQLLRSTGERVRDVTTPGTRPRARRAAVPTNSGGEFGTATTYGTRVRGWKRSAIAAALVFGVAMAGITAYELMSGQDLSGGRGTTISGVVRGGDPGPRQPATPPPGDPDRGTDQRPGRGTDQRPDQQGTPQEQPQPRRSEPSRPGDTPTPTPTPSTPDPGQGDTGDGTPPPAPAPSEPDGPAASAPAPPAAPAPAPSSGAADGPAR